MALAAFPRELIVSIFEQLEECDINALFQTNAHLYDLLSEVLYQQHVNDSQGAGAWRAIDQGDTDALMKFIAYRLNLHACGQPSNFAVNKALLDIDSVAGHEESETQREGGKKRQGKRQGKRQREREKRRRR